MAQRTEKRKVSYQQAQALAAGQHVARTNQRRRVAENQAAAEAQAEQDRKAAEHKAEGLHTWTNWEYDFDNMTETRSCRECDETQTRKLSL